MMKKNVYTAFSLRFAVMIAMIFTVASVFSAFVGNPPDGKTGAPISLDASEGSCLDCHTAENPDYQAETTMMGLPDLIVPNTTYQISLVTTATAGTPVRAGFELVALDDGTLSNAGDLMDITSNGTATSTAGTGREYIKHSAPKNMDGNKVQWDFEWTSPEAGENVSFYATTLLANMGDGNSNDKTIFFSKTYQMDKSSTTTQPEYAQSIQLYPNPARGATRILIDQAAGNEQVTIMDINNRIVHTLSDVTSGQWIELSDFPSGLYYVIVQSGKKSEIKKLVLIE